MNAASMANSRLAWALLLPVLSLLPLPCGGQQSKKPQGYQENVEEARAPQKKETKCALMFLVLAADKPLRDANVTAEWSNSKGTLPTGKDGTVQIPDLPAGTKVSYHVEFEGYDPTPRQTIQHQCPEHELIKVTMAPLKKSGSP